jgi:hypothetical protein
MPITISDTFTRADTTNGSLGSTETGMTLAWQNTTSWRISTNRATNDASGYAPAWVNVYQPSATISVLTGSTNGPGVSFWVKDSSNYWIAYMYSYRYLDSVTTNCSAPCTVFEQNCVCGGCNTNAVTYSRSTSTGTGNVVSLSCAGCSTTSCPTAPTCNAVVSGVDYGNRVSSCGGTCYGRTIDSQVCATTNTCGTFSSNSTCTTSACSTSGPYSIKKCGTRSCGEIGTTCNGTGCGFNSRTNQNCLYSCSKSGGGNVNAANSCDVTKNTCPPCATGSTNNYRRSYEFYVQRIVGGSASTVYSSTVYDSTSAGLSLAAIKVITTNGNYRAIGYSDTAMTSVAVDTGTSASGVSDWQNAIGHGMIRQDMGTAQPNQGYSADNFSLEYEPLGGDSVGIIQG